MWNVWFVSKSEIDTLREEVARLRKELWDLRTATVMHEDRDPHPLWGHMYGQQAQTEVEINRVVRMMLDHLGLKVTKKRAHESVALEPLDTAKKSA